MAARTPPPITNTKIGQMTEMKTTTISTIVVKAGTESFITVGLLQCPDYARVRIDEMRPPLLSIGSGGAETARLKSVHSELMHRLSEKEEECEALLKRAAELPREKNEQEAPVYAAMATSLDKTWRELLRRLRLRGDLLDEVATFYEYRGYHEEITRVSLSALSAFSTSSSPDGLAKQIKQAVEDMTSATVRAMDCGASVMTGIRVLGELSDNERREMEIVEALEIIEDSMMKIVTEYQRVVDAWASEKMTRYGTQGMEGAQEVQIGDDVTRTLDEISSWLGRAGKRLLASNEEGIRQLQKEAEENRSRLVSIISTCNNEQQLERAGELAQGCEELIALSKASLNKSNRLRNFFVSANNMRQQLLGMERDMEQANESMAGELAPLARQKGNTFKEEANEILENERLSHDEKRQVTVKRDEILDQVARIERIATEKSDSGKQLARENLRRGREWLVREAEPWLSAHGDLGGTISTAERFLQEHSQFAQSVIDRDQAIQFALNESARLSEDEQRVAREFEERYNAMKRNLETRIQLAKTFQQVQEFAQELESSFISMAGLININAEHSERGIEQMAKVFEMIEETLGQERQQGERFITSTTSHRRLDSSLKTTQATNTVCEILVRHENRFAEMAEKWRMWVTSKTTVQQVQLQPTVELSRVLEEVQMWQEETVEIIRLWEQGTATRSVQEDEEVFRRVEEVKRQMAMQNERMEKSAKTTTDESWTRLQETRARQAEIAKRLQSVQDETREKMVVVERREVQQPQISETSRALEEVQMWQEEVVETIRLWDAPRPHKQTVHDKEETIKKVEVIKKDAVVQNEKLNTVAKTVTDEATTRRVAETAKRQMQIEERVREQEKRMQEQRMVEEQTRKVLEEVQMWQDEVVQVIQLWETPKQQRTLQQTEETIKNVQILKKDVAMQSERLSTVTKEAVDEKTTSQVQQTLARQKNIDWKVKEVEKKLVQEQQTAKQLEHQGQETRKVLEEVQMWQDEVVQVIQLWEAPKQQRTVVETTEVLKNVETLKKDVAMQSERVQQVSKVATDQQTTSQVQQTLARQKNIDWKVKEVEKKLVQEQKNGEQIAQQGQETRKVLEEVQMWQDEVVQVIQLWEAPKQERTVMGTKEVIKNVESLKKDVATQSERLNQVAKDAVDQKTNSEIQQTFARQKNIDWKVKEVEKKLIQESKAVEEQTRKIVEEVQMWQDEVVQVIQLWETPKQEKTVVEIEETIKNVDVLKNDVNTQSERLNTVSKIVTDEQTSSLVQQTMARQKNIDWKVKEVEKKLQDEKKAVEQQAKKTIEEVEMWQTDVVEIIKLWEAQPKQKRTVAVKEEITMGIQKLKQDLLTQNEKLIKATKNITAEEIIRRLQKARETQKEIEDRLMKLENRLTTEELVVEQDMRRPQLVTQLMDKTVEEGQKVELSVRVEAQPEPTITWLKDGVDVEQTMDYRKTFFNGVATLTIEETFIEDTAMYTMKAKNAAGEAGTSARLVVKSTSARTSEGPRVVRGLKNTAIEEGEKLFLDCVVVAQPEPQVVWFKEETTIKEDDRTSLHFKGDHCSLTVQPTKASDSGVYTAKARNVHGEATSFCQVKVAPKRAPPPPTPPKPERTGLPKPPTMQCTLTNSTYQPGMKAVLQVLVSGNPRPHLDWSVDGRPVQTTTRIHITEEADGWSRLTFDEILKEDAGLYMLVAENELGEARTGATIHVQPGLQVLTSRDQSQEEASGSEKVTVMEAAPTVPPPVVTEKKEETRVETTTTTAQPQVATTVQYQPSTDRRAEVEEFTQRDERIIQLQHQQAQLRLNGHVNTESPVPSTTRTQTDEFGQREVTEIGLSNTATAPDIFRPLHREQTVNESEELFLECLLVGNPRPKVQWYFNDQVVHKTSRFAEIVQSGDSYSLRIPKASLENAGYYKLTAENVRGRTESLCVVHVRPAALGPVPRKQQHTTVSEEFAIFEYEQVLPDHHLLMHGHNQSRIPILKGAAHPTIKEEKIKHIEHLEECDLDDRQRVGNPPHFSQTLLSTVAADGQSAKFEGIVTGWPAPEVQWEKAGMPISRNSHPQLNFSNIGGRVSLAFPKCTIEDSGKYKCTAANEWGVATSSAQLVVRPRTVAPDFISRLISEEVAEGETLKWTVRVTGDPLPKVTWLRDGCVVPNCEEVRLIDEGDGVHSMLIMRVELADSGQFTCLAENVAGEARSTADLVVRPSGAEPGHYFHVTKVTQEKQVKGQQVGGRNEAIAVESPVV